MPFGCGLVAGGRVLYQFQTNDLKVGTVRLLLLAQASSRPTRTPPQTLKGANAQTGVAEAATRMGKTGDGACRHIIAVIVLIQKRQTESSAPTFHCPAEETMPVLIATEGASPGENFATCGNPKPWTTTPHVFFTRPQ